ncbi:hypothetical protein [Sagittula sp. NFXS13]|uniref:hypothetical protein n=1 Tax=Sagittula sp. NFXS13 TaxID=2819095 RepID=UPI0032DFBAC4
MPEKIAGKPVVLEVEIVMQCLDADCASDHVQARSRRERIADLKIWPGLPDELRVLTSVSVAQAQQKNHRLVLAVAANKFVLKVGRVGRAGQDHSRSIQLDASARRAEGHSIEHVGQGWAPTPVEKAKFVRMCFHVGI